MSALVRSYYSLYSYRKNKKISWIEDFTTNLVIQTTANYKWYNTQNLKLLLYPAKWRPFIFIFEGLMAFPFSHCAYLASKHGVVGFTRAYAKVGACHNGGGHFAIIVFRINGLETQLKFCYLCSSNICKVSLIHRNSTKYVTEIAHAHFQDSCETVHPNLHVIHQLRSAGWIDKFIFRMLAMYKDGKSCPIL